MFSGELIEVFQIGFFALFCIYTTNALIQRYAEGSIGIVTFPLLVLGGIEAYWPFAILPSILGAVSVLVAIVLSSRQNTKGMASLSA